MIIVVTRGTHTHENGSNGVLLSQGFYTLGLAFDLPEDHQDYASLMHYGYARHATDAEIEAFMGVAQAPVVTVVDDDDSGDNKDDPQDDEDTGKNDDEGDDADDTDGDKEDDDDGEDGDKDTDNADDTKDSDGASKDDGEDEGEDEQPVRRRRRRS